MDTGQGILYHHSLGVETNQTKHRKSQSLSATETGKVVFHCDRGMGAEKRLR